MTMPYGATVLEHFRRPRNQRTLDRPTAAHEGFNPLCGDRVRIELEVEGAVIRAAAFTANACAICTASASLLTERVSGESVDVASRLTDEEVLADLGADLPAARRLCAILPVRALRAALAGLRRKA
ncbi:MAG TPA: iron-sulfur cluster assembly scaffold protein [Gemmatimonadaceae bacterium]|jgi:nitrogen fixation NifU-like protein